MTPRDAGRSIRVFISYSHDSAAHKEKVLELSERLRADGIDSSLDQYIENEGPSEGWPRWMDEQLRVADFVLLVCTTTYRRRVEGREEPGLGHGVLWEGALIYQHIYNAATRNEKFLPVLLEGASMEDVPLPLQGVPNYNPVNEAGYEGLYRRLTGQPRVQKGQLGALHPLPSRKVTLSTLDQTVDTPEREEGGKNTWLWRQPLLWLAGIATVAVIGALLWKKVFPDSAANPPDFRLQLQVRLNGDFGPVDKAPAMRLAHRLPKERGTNLLEGGKPIADREFEYDSPVLMPLDGEKYLGKLHRLVTSGGVYRDPGFNDVCFERKVRSLARDPIIRVNCEEGGACQVAPDDFGWAKPCSPANPQSGSWWLIPRVYAQTGQRPPEKGWVVPSLQTLRKQQTGNQNPAFTEFTLTSGPLSGLKNADRLTYAIRVNGALIYIDGLPPETNSVPFNAGTGINLAFGLENLDFSGKQAGYEDIEVTLQFSQSARLIRSATFRLRYVALRSTADQVSGGADLTIRWKATYHPGQRDDAYQIFLLSTAKQQSAEDLQRRIDAANLSLDAVPVVAVVRPPVVENPTFGVVLGIRQPSGQVKFTFDDQTSRRLCRGVIQMASRSRVVDRSAFRRNVEKRGDSQACLTF